MAKTSLALAFVAGLLAGPLDGHAQAPAPKAPAPVLAPDPAYEAARSAFEALPEADRRSVQQALVWTGDYKGTADGAFGRGTRNAIAAFAMRMKLPTTGMLDSAARAALIAAGDKAAKAVGFARFDDPATGAIVGLPLALLPRVAPSATGKRWTSADGALAFETMALPEEPGRDLAAVYAGTIGDGPDRRITYKVLRPEFFVVSGESRGATFYTRMARGTVGGRAVLRGYTFFWPTARADLEPVALAVANAYVAFPAAPMGPAPGPLVAASKPAPPIAVPPPSPVPALPARTFGGTALGLAPGRYVAAPPSAGCRDPRIGLVPARLVRADTDSGLWLLETPPPSGAPRLVPPVLGPEPMPGADLALVFLVPAADEAATSGEMPKADLLVAAGTWQAAVAGSPPRVVAPLQGAIGGALAFDRAGRLAAIVAAPPRVPRLVAGMVPQASWDAVPARGLVSLAGLKLADTAAAAADLSSAAIAGLARPLVAALTCAP